ncbi:MAG: AraC family transcriptional regulator [Gemmatimonadaceae bacterium]
MHDEYASVTRVALLETGTTVELLRAGYLTHRFSPHAHEEFAVGVIEGGAVRTRLRYGMVVIPAGRIVTLNPGEVHCGAAASPEGYRYRMFYLGAPLLRRVLGRAGTAEPAPGARLAFDSATIDDPRLARRLVRAHALLEAGGERFSAEGRLVDALGALVERHGVRVRPAERAPVAGDHVVRVVREFLEEEHARVVTLAELSVLTGLSPFHVSRTFRAAVGVPPYAYLSLVRVRRARELIARGYPIGVVTHATGFADQSHFTKHFKRVVGVPPGQYARETGHVASVRPGPAGIVPPLREAPLGREAPMGRRAPRLAARFATV